MRAEDWKRVRLHDRLIYADLYEGVWEAKVVELDIRLPEDLTQYPYGKSAETGSVRIQYVKEGVAQELIENLANLVKWKGDVFRSLKRSWEDLRDEKEVVTELESDFNRDVVKARGL